MSSNFNDNSDDDDNELEDEEDEEDEEDDPAPVCLLLPHKPFCGRLTSSALSKSEEYSEPETYSSGFSEAPDFRICHRQTQTEAGNITLASNSLIDLEQHFQTTPRYKLIFKEIFQVLKQANTADMASAPKESANREKKRKIREETIAAGRSPDWEASEFPSLASASVARLRILEESYAEVLRKGIERH